MLTTDVYECTRDLLGTIASLGCAASRPSRIDVLSGTLQDPVAFDPPEESVDVADTTRPWD